MQLDSTIPLLQYCSMTRQSFIALDEETYSDRLAPLHNTLTTCRRLMLSYLGDCME